MSMLVRRHPYSAAILLAPAAAIVGVFLLYPLVNGIWLGFTNASPLRETTRFVGTRNYDYLLSDTDFYLVVANSFGIVGASIAISVVVGFVLALLLNMGLRGTQAFRVGIFQIWVVPWISVAILWGWLFNADFGIVNFILMDVGVLQEKLNWFANQFTARLVIILGFAWRMIPFMMVVSLAALQGIPQEIIESSKIDGATAFERLRFIILPLLRNTILMVALLQAVKLFQEITLPWVLTQGGPVNATMMLSLYTYKLAFQEWDFGMASSVGTLWLAVLSAFAIAYLRFTVRR